MPKTPKKCVCGEDCAYSHWYPGRVGLTYNKRWICEWCREADSRKKGKEGGRGCSDITKNKEEQFKRAIRSSLILSMGEKIKDYPFWYVSLNCGFSANAAGVWCDSVYFLDLLTREFPERAFRAFLCDEKEDYVGELRRTIYQRFGPGRPIGYLPRKNKGVLRSVYEEICKVERSPRYAVGCVVSDPNGPGEDHTPWDDLIWFRQKCPRVDLVLNINARSVKRSAGVGKVKHTRRHHSVGEVLADFPRTEWAVSPVFEGKKNSYIVAVGRENQYRPNEQKHFGLYDVRTPEGQRHLRDADTHKGKRAKK